MDDQDYVELNQDIRSINLESITKWFTKDYVLMYVPLVMGSFAIDYQWWGNNPFGYHLTNVALHALNAVVVFLLLHLLTNSLSISFLTSIIFIVHPIQIESVAWISERKNLLSSLFFLLCVYSYRLKRFWLCVAAFLCAVLSKPNTVVLPVILLGSDYFFGHFFSNKKRFFLFGLMLVMSAALFVYMLLINHATEIHFRGNSVLINTYVMLTVFFRYLWLLIYPFNQQLYYLTEIYKTWLDPRVFLSIVGVISFILLIVWCVRKRKQLGFWLVWFLITLSPTLNFVVPMGSLMHDRYLYLPIIGFFTALWLIVFKLKEKFHFSNISIALGAIAIVTLITSQSVLACQRLDLWGRSFELWAEDVRKSKYPDARLMIGLASELSREKKTDASIKQMNDVIKTFHDNEAILRQIWNYISLNDFESAEKLLSEIDIKRIKMSNYWMSFYYEMYARCLFHSNDFKKTEEFLLQSINFYESDSASAALADIYFLSNRTAEALRVLEKALNLAPQSEVILSKLCRYYLDQKEYERAYKLYLDLKHINPNNSLVAHVEKQIALYAQKN